MIWALGIIILMAVCCFYMTHVSLTKNYTGSPLTDALLGMILMLVGLSFVACAIVVAVAMAITALL